MALALPPEPLHLGLPLQQPLQEGRSSQSQLSELQAPAQALLQALQTPLHHSPALLHLALQPLLLQGRVPRLLPAQLPARHRRNRPPQPAG